MAKRTKGMPGTRRKRRATKAAKAIQTLPILHADTAGVDIGATEIYVAIPADPG